MLTSIDLFVGCGGLCDGFKQSGVYKLLAAVEWETAPLACLKKRLKTKWKMNDADNRVIRFDIQRIDELLHGWTNDAIYGSHRGLDSLITQKVDVIIGGPPCQAYSIAGRVRDKNGMKNDYRNYLFESYLAIVKYYKPKAFVFENVPGILSAKPGNGDLNIIKTIHHSFSENGYSLLSNLENAEIDMSEYGVPQKRNRIIILGLSKEIYKNKCEEMLDNFYNKLLPQQKVITKNTVRDAISDLPKLYPLSEDVRINGRKLSHSLPNTEINGHFPRYHSRRDIAIFEMLAKDIESGERKYSSVESLKKLYTEKTGKVSSVHKYHVCSWDEPSNLIPAHLYKDGLRHIHPDAEQARTLTVREAARLQTFDDDFNFGESSTDAYKMIGNAVPPLFAKKVAIALHTLLQDK